MQLRRWGFPMHLLLFFKSPNKDRFISNPKMGFFPCHRLQLRRSRTSSSGCNGQRCKLRTPGAGWAPEVSKLSSNGRWKKTVELMLWLIGNSSWGSLVVAWGVFFFFSGHVIFWFQLLRRGQELLQESDLFLTCIGTAGIPMIWFIYLLVYCICWILLVFFSFVFLCCVCLCVCLFCCCFWYSVLFLLVVFVVVFQLITFENWTRSEWIRRWVD